MYRFLNSIYEHDPSGMLIISIPLFFIGLRLVYRYPKMHSTGTVLSLFTGLALILEHYFIKPLEPGLTFPRLSFMAIMTCWFVIGPYWIAGFIVGVLCEYFLLPVYRLWKRIRESSRITREHQARLVKEQEEVKQRRQEEERLRPERERQQRLHEEAMEITAKRRERMQLLMMKLRAACEFFYTQHIPEISDRLPRKEFDRLLKRYLDESIPFELLEENGNKILALLKQHATRTGSSQNFEGLSGMLQDFRREKENIESLNLPPDEEEVIMVTLDSRMAELQDEFIRNMKPRSSR